MFCYERSSNQPISVKLWNVKSVNIDVETFCVIPLFDYSVGFKSCYFLFLNHLKWTSPIWLSLICGYRGITFLLGFIRKGNP